MKWTEGYIHVAMRNVLRSWEWTLIAGEYPGGSDHDLHPLNIVDPTVACDRSPDPRRHSLGELIPDLVALKGTKLIIAEAKVGYDDGDRLKLISLLGEHIDRFWTALEKFADERDFPQLKPVRKLRLYPTLVFRSGVPAPIPSDRFSYIRIIEMHEAVFEGALRAGSP
ncbi:MAG: hypothetical protein ACREHF_10935 [Rhizomicrobium sp.]